MLAHPAASHASNISTPCPNVSAAKRTCACTIDSHQLHCMTCKSGGGVDLRHSALARCLADLNTTHTGTKAFIEQSIPGLAHSTRTGQTEGARMDIVVELRGSTCYIDTAIVTPFSSSPGLISAASGRPGYMAKREETTKIGRYSRINLAPFSRSQEDRAIMPSSSSNISTTTRTTHQQRPSETPGRQSKPPYTIASLNNNSGRSPRDRFNHCLTHATPFYRLLFLASVRPEPLYTLPHPQPQSTRATHLPQFTLRSAPPSLPTQCFGFPPCRFCHRHRPVPAHREHQPQSRRHEPCTQGTNVFRGPRRDQYRL